MSEELNMLELDRIINLFNSKKWEKDEKNKASLYNRYIAKYKSLKNNEEKEIFLILSEQYTLVKLDDYCKLLISILNNIFETKNKKEILVFPLLSMKDIKKIKSSTFMCYLFKHVEMNYHDKIEKKNFTIIESYDILQKKATDNKYLFLVDDYIGSGNQCILALKDILKNLDVDLPIYIISLYINEKGKDKITKEIKSHDNIKLKYAVETKYNLQHYDEILKDIGITDSDRNYKGYSDCGELITLVRTPNNTIPLFRNKKNAPFPRNAK